MDTSSVVDLAREAMWVTIMVSAPLLAVVLVIGVLIGIVQAATSINEMTLSFIPKLVGLAFAIVIFGNWQIAVLVDYARGMFQRIPALFT
jgi:flagellar biosynthetic protein FliQ